MAPIFTDLPLWIWWAGAPAIFILLLLLVWWWRRPPTLLVVMQDDSGRVRISRRALEEALTYTCRQEDAIVSARVRVRLQEGLISPVLKLRVRRGVPIKKLTGYLQQQTRALLQEQFSLEQCGPITVTITGIQADRTEDRKSELTVKDRTSPDGPKTAD